MDAAERRELFERYLLDIPQLHTWDNGETWNAGGFWAGHFRAIFETLNSGVGPMRVLETGAGNSTICFLIAGAAAVISIAPDNALFGRIHAYCAASNIDTASWRAVADISEHALPPIAEHARQTGELIDFALIDGAHGWPTVFVDFCYTYAMLREGGYMMIDDIQIHAVKELARLMSRSWQFELVTDLQKSLIFRKIGNQTYMGDFGAQPYIVEKSATDAANGQEYKLF